MLNKHYEQAQKGKGKVEPKKKEKIDPLAFLDSHPSYTKRIKHIEKHVPPTGNSR